MEWTVMIRNRGGDRWFHRVPGLKLTVIQAEQLACYLARINSHCQVRVASYEDTAITIRRKNRQWVKIPILDNGVLPFDTDPPPDPRGTTVAAIAGSLVGVEVPDTLKNDVEGIEMKPVGDGWFNVYDNGTQVGEVDYDAKATENPWSAVAYTWGLAEAGAVSELGPFGTRLEALAAVVTKWREFNKSA